MITRKNRNNSELSDPKSKTKKGCIKCTFASTKVKNEWNSYKRNFPTLIDHRSKRAGLFKVNDYEMSDDFPTMVNDFHASKLGEK